MKNPLHSERKAGQKKDCDFEVLKALCTKLFNDFLHGQDLLQHTFHYRRDYDLGNLVQYFLAKTKNFSLNPSNFSGSVQTEDDLFDMLECSYQFLKDKNSDRNISRRFALKLNQDALSSYGFEMSLLNGEINHKPEDGMVALVNEQVPFGIIQDDEAKIRHAIELFFKRNVTDEDKKSGIKELGDLLEHVRKELDEIPHLQTDGNLIFEILNTYGIRHHNDKQNKLPEPYLSWTFYLLLNTVKTFLKLKNSVSKNK